MNVIHFIVFIILFLFLILFAIRDNTMVEVESSIDNNTYLVRKGNSQKNKANRLANMNLKIKKLFKILRSQHLRRKGISMMLENYDGVLEETRIGDTDIAYNENKGDKIAICINLENSENITFFVILHELAHGMTNEYKHNKEFWDNMSFLIEVAIEHGLYKYQDYTDEPDEFCEMEINSTPYEKN